MVPEALYDIIHAYLYSIPLHEPWISVQRGLIGHIFLLFNLSFFLVAYEITSIILIL